MATIGALATFADRIGIVEDTINSLYPQLDLLMIYCNDEASFRNARKTTAGNVKKFWGPNITDRGKFWFCRELAGTDNVYFTFDDDLIYPKNYVRTTVERLNRYDNKSIVSYHGKELIRKNIKSYYDPQTYEEEIHSYRVLGHVSGDHEVDIIGTGCMAFHLDYFAPVDLREDMMADIEVSVLAKLQGKRRIVLQHPMGWVRYHPAMERKWTIWDHFQDHPDTRQVELLREHFG